MWTSYLYWLGKKWIKFKNKKKNNKPPNKFHWKLYQSEWEMWYNKGKTYVLNFSSLSEFELLHPEYKTVGIISSSCQLDKAIPGLKKLS